jgi:hypothetical protein
MQVIFLKSIARIKIIQLQKI